MCEDFLPSLFYLPYSSAMSIIFGVIRLHYIFLEISESSKIGLSAKFGSESFNLEGEYFMFSDFRNYVSSFCFQFRRNHIDYIK